MKFAKHLVFICPGFAAHEQDSSTISSLQDLLMSLTTHHPNLKVTIIALEYPYQQGSYVWNNHTVHAIGGANKKGIHRFHTLYKAYQCFKQIRQAESVDLVHSFWLGPTTLVGNRIRAKYGIPHLAHAMGQDVLASNRYLKFIGWSNIQKLIYLSDFHQKQSVVKFPNTQVIPFGLDTSHFRLLPKEKRDIDLLGVGSLIPLKQFGLFVATIQQLVAAGNPVKALIIGSGPQKDQLEQLIVQHQLQAHIQLLGQVPRDVVFDYMSRSKVLLHPAKYESFGMIFIEGLAHGMSVVSFDVGAAIQHQHWHLADSPNQLKGLCLEALSQHETRVAFPAKFSIKHVVDSLAQVYEEMWVN